MQRFKNILVATDTRWDEHPIVKEAADIAAHNGASLKIVDVVPDFPWTVRLTMKDHEHIRELMEQEKQEKLEALAAQIRANGVDVETKVLKGKTSVEIIREVLRCEHDLVMRRHKGKESGGRGFFGNTGMRLLRKCPCAVWLVTPSRVHFQHVLGCVDTATDDPRDIEMNDKVFELSRNISQFHGGFYSIVHAWSVWNEPMLKRRMDPDSFSEMVQSTQHQIEMQMEQFLAKHGSSLNDKNIHLMKGDTSAAISHFVNHHEVDLVVMGTVGRSGVSGMVMGNTAEQILNQLTCSVLALKPSDFVSPIQLNN